MHYKDMNWARVKFGNFKLEGKWLDILEVYEDAVNVLDTETNKEEIVILDDIVMVKMNSNTGLEAMYEK